MSVRINPFRWSELAGVLPLLDDSLRRDPISESVFTRKVLLDPNFRAEGALVASCDGEVAGFCLAIARQTPLENAPTDLDRGYITLIAVRSDLQRQGIGGELLEHAEAYLRSQDRTTALISPYSPGYFTPGVDPEAYAPAISFFARHGYRELYRAISMKTSLPQPGPPAWSQAMTARLKAEGICIESYEPALTVPLLDFVAREFPGDWVRVVREAMGAVLSGAAAARLVIAHEGGEILGFVHHENERFGPIGVAASRRGRGVGHALMFAALRAMGQEGFRVGWFLWSDEKTARRLYDNAQFRIDRRFTVLSKAL